MLNMVIWPSLSTVLYCIYYKYSTGSSRNNIQYLYVVQVPGGSYLYHIVRIWSETVSMHTKILVYGY